MDIHEEGAIHDTRKRQDTYETQLYHILGQEPIIILIKKQTPRNDNHRQTRASKNYRQIDQAKPQEPTPFKELWEAYHSLSVTATYPAGSGLWIQ